MATKCSSDCCRTARKPPRNRADSSPCRWVRQAGTITAMPRANCFLAVAYRNRSLPYISTHASLNLPWSRSQRANSSLRSSFTRSRYSACAWKLTRSCVNRRTSSSVKLPLNVVGRPLVLFAYSGGNMGEHPLASVLIVCVILLHGACQSPYNTKTLARRSFMSRRLKGSTGE